MYNRHFIKLFSSKKALYPLISQQAALIAQASLNLTYLVETNEVAKWQSFEAEIKQLERAADAILTEIQEELFNSRYTPKERTQLQSIAAQTDNFMDAIYGCAKSFLLYFPEKIDAPLVDLCTYINGEAQSLKTLIEYFQDIKDTSAKILMQCDKISEFEHESDDAYDSYIGYIFTHEKDAIKLMKYKNIAEQLEITSDACKEISDNIRNLMLLYF
ncbi:MAG: DUF47 family protein [Bacteroidales bacterium]|nr:DUF47 family protein [Bacteroidales bacterium]